MCNIEKADNIVTIFIIFRMKKNISSVNSLIIGIQTIISKNRCSLSNDEIKLLEATIKQLKVCSNLQKKEEPLDWEVILELIKPILKLFLSDYE